MNSARQLLSAFIGIFLLCAPLHAHASDTAATDIAARYESPTTYTITRKGKPIGTHSINFDIDGSDLTVDVRSKIRVTILKVPVFSFDYESTETWKNGELVSATSEVQENNKNTRVSLRSADGKTVLNNAKGKQTVDKLLFTSNHWNSNVTGATRVFNTLNGKASDVTITLVNDKAILEGITTSHYRYSGKINADVWYDRNGRWVKLQFKGEDGSNIEYMID